MENEFIELVTSNPDYFESFLLVSDLRGQVIRKFENQFWSLLVDSLKEDWINRPNNEIVFADRMLNISKAHWSRAFILSTGHGDLNISFVEKNWENYKTEEQFEALYLQIINRLTKLNIGLILQQFEPAIWFCSVYDWDNTSWFERISPEFIAKIKDIINNAMNALEGLEL